MPVSKWMVRLDRLKAVGNTDRIGAIVAMCVCCIVVQSFHLTCMFYVTHFRGRNLIMKEKPYQYCLQLYSWFEVDSLYCWIIIQYF